MRHNEFDPVPANSPCDAKGWNDRDALAALLQSTPDARPVGDLTEPQWEEIAESCVHLNFEECYLDSVKSMGELILAAARIHRVTNND